jgi:hypothetical protein
MGLRKAEYRRKNADCERDVYLSSINHNLMRLQLAEAPRFRAVGNARTTFSPTARARQASSHHPAQFFE